MKPISVLKSLEEANFQKVAVVICWFEYLNLLLILRLLWYLIKQGFQTLTCCVTKAIGNTDKEVTEKYKYVGILRNESPKLNCNKRKINLKLNNR